MTIFKDLQFDGLKVKASGKLLYFGRELINKQGLDIWVQNEKYYQEFLELNIPSILNGIELGKYKNFVDGFAIDELMPE